MYAIEISGLTKLYRSRRFKSHVAVNDLNLNVASGEVFGFLGPNGAGKSTTIKSIVGLIKPNAGKITICGIQSTNPASRQKVGYLSENPSFYDYLSAREYLNLVGEIFGLSSKRIASEAERIFAMLDLSEVADKPMRIYSKGMVQRVGIAQALLHDPDVYILDEPMSGLDPLGRALVKDIIVDLKKRGKCVFFSTHITSDVERVCDRVGIIQRGELRLVDRVEDILTRGITGYTVRFTRQDVAGYEEIFADKKEFGRVVSEIEASGAEIAMVEPVRKSMEDLFLEIVKGGNPLE